MERRGRGVGRGSGEEREDQGVGERLNEDE